MEEEKKLENMPSDNTCSTAESQTAEDVKDEGAQKAMSSEALKVNQFNFTKDPDFDDEEFMKPLSYWERKKREYKANKVVKPKHVKRKLTPAEKTLLGLLGVAVVCVVIYFIYYFAHYVNYDGYKKYLRSYEYETASEYMALSDSSPSVPGFDLVAETDTLKMYTDKTTANVAVYDKRNGEIVYTNPLNADDDTVANGANKSIMKSQFLLYYYNKDIISGTLNSYNDCISKGTYTVESIADGVKYTYTITDGLADFDIPLEYRLKDDYLEVTIPSANIVERGECKIYRIQLLRYMAATSYDDNGYMVVPNGTGSTINFNNGKTTAAAYSAYIYDIDPLAANYTTVENLETVRLPIYGICKENSGVLVSVEDSAANCVITAGVSGTFSDYNYAYPTFVMRIADNLRMFGNASTDVFVLEPDLYDSNITVRYTMLDENNKGYDGLANYYRNRLVNEGVLTAKADSSETSDIPFYYDIVSGVRETGHFLGAQYLHTFAMTTFKEAGEISDEIKAAGISNQVMNLQGWFNGGYYHNATDSVNITGKLGGKSGLEKLNDKIADNGGKLYGDVSFQKVSFADKYFPYTKVASRYYGAGYVATFGLVNPTTLRNTASLGYLDNRYDILSPKYLPRYVESFVKKTKNVDIDGVSLRDLGNFIPSDKKRTCLIDREEALDIIAGQYELLDASGKNIMTNEANAYTFAYTDDILNVPLEATKFDIVDDTIPLYEMIIHGYIDYSSELLNYENEDNMDKMALTLIETGTAPHYVFTKEESSRMKMTALNRMYSTTFDVWKDNAFAMYEKVNGALKYVNNAAIVGHEIINSNVRKVTYDNGVTIIINYGKEAITVDGITVEPLSYGMEGI